MQTKYFCDKTHAVVHYINDIRHKQLCDLKATSELTGYKKNRVYDFLLIQNKKQSYFYRCSHFKIINFIDKIKWSATVIKNYHRTDSTIQ